MNNMPQHTAVVVLSGGQDSTTCLYMAKQEFSNVYAITFDYGQRHDREIEAAKIIGWRARVKEQRFVKLDGVLLSTSPLVDKDSTLEQYQDFNSLPGGIEKTFVPYRNQLFLTIAANYALHVNAGYIFTGVSAEDYGGYPDCRKTFIDSLQATCELATERRVRIATPLMYKTKKQTVESAMLLHGCYEALAYSHTAYDGQYPPLGKDHASLLRAKGFEQADIPDPLVLRAYLEGVLPVLPSARNYRRVNVQRFLERIEAAMKETM